MPALNISHFDMGTLKPDATVLLVGKRGTGKSTLLKDLMFNMASHFDFGIAMSPTEESTQMFSSVIPESLTFSEFNEKAVGRMLAYQKRHIKRAGGKHRNMFIIMDDCAFDAKSLKNKFMREVFMNGRHRKIFLVFAVQYMMDVPSCLRGQIDYVFAMRDNIIDQREKLWKYFCGMFTDYKDFSAVMDSCTQGYNCLTINNTVRSNIPEDCVFWYCAEPCLPPFQLCSPVFWRLHEHFFRDWELEDEGGMTDQQGGGGGVSPNNSTALVVRVCNKRAT